MAAKQGFVLEEGLPTTGEDSSGSDSTAKEVVDSKDNGPKGSEAPDLPWLVIYTKPRQEKKLAERLQQAGYSVYCPTQRIKKQWSDRWKWVEQPLFTSHIFIQIEPERRDAVYFVPGFVRFLFWLKKPAQVRPQEIEILKKWLNDYTPEAIKIETLQPGQRIQVKSGPLLGHSAFVHEHRGQMLELILEELQVKIKVDLASTQIEAS
jgi:transcription antitermination factor NusG